ncbi:hypothetical protein TIFTF001_005491 [Ficus carica]|uniref:Uncharacterized protein n=1 Tax=Ficus carica TaxID=3494 RepID=A0AA87ZLU5_FICCA|nr:hypothetical protein TIFTF001_005491 [Ficus carica]
MTGYKKSVNTWRAAAGLSSQAHGCKVGRATPDPEFLSWLTRSLGRAGWGEWFRTRDLLLFLADLTAQIVSGRPWGFLRAVDDDY